MKHYKVKARFETVAIDVTGPFPRIQKGNQFILDADDYFNKWFEVFALTNQETSTVA